MIKLRYSLQIFALMLISGACMAQDEVNPHKKLTKSFLGAVKRDIPNRNDKFFDSTFYGKITSAQADRTISNFIRTNGQIVAIEKTLNTRIDAIVAYEAEAPNVFSKKSDSEVFFLNSLEEQKINSHYIHSQDCFLKARYFY